LGKLGSKKSSDSKRAVTKDSAQRRSGDNSVFGFAKALLIFLVLGCMAGTFALLPKVPGSMPLRAVESLRAAQVRMEMALEHGLRENTEAQTQASAQAAKMYAHQLVVLRVELTEAAIHSAALAPMEQAWEQLRTQLAAHGITAASVAATQALGKQAEALSTEVMWAVDERLARLHLWLKVLGAALLLTLLVAVRALFKQRQQLRQSLHRASDELGAGDWQEAVKTLRDERAGAPSAFDAFAVGMENALGQSERRWHALAELSADWYWETDAQGAFKWLSQQPSFLTDQAWTAEDVLGRRIDQVPFFRPPSQGWHAFSEHQARQLAFRDLEFQVSARRGNRLMWVTFSGRPQLDAQGGFLGYEGVGRDITERRDGQERLVSSEQRWSMMVGLASDWYWESDTEHRMLPLRPELRARYGAMFEAVEGRTLWDVYRGADHRRMG
jgi:PAS domain S-box-containing protein